MKKWLLTFTAIILLIFTIFFYLKRFAIQTHSPNGVLSAIEAPTTTPIVWKQSTVINIEGVPIRISWTQVKPEGVELYSNLKEQQLSEEIKVDKSCQILVNGGFYSKENTHLGLFIANFKITSPPLQNALLNGFLWINSDQTVRIASSFPNISPRLALQSGPLLVQDKKPLVLSINNDELNRRIVAAITSDNQLYFLAIYRDSSEYQGPLLGNLPQIIALFGKKNNIDISDAINLDGGSASVFITNYDLLRELAHIGSYFCAR